MKLQNIFRFVPATILLLLLIHSSLLAQHIEYRVIQIPAQLEWGRLNDSGAVAATTWTYTTWMWNKGLVTNLPGIGGNRYANDINNNSVVVGSVEDTERHWGHACVWQSGMLSIFDASGYLVWWANSINSSGTVVGETNDTADAAWPAYPFIYTGSVTVLDELEDYSFNAINDGNVIAGPSWTSDIYDNGPAFQYYNGTVTFLSDPGSSAIAYDINNSNHVLGELGGVGCCLWKDGTQVFLGPLTRGGSRGGLNDHDAVVGFAWNLGAVIWENGQVRRLDTLIDPNLGLHFWNGCDINNKGEILCMGSDSLAYLLIPVPTITKPLKDDIWISGEKNTIKWNYRSPGKSMVIEFSTDSGQTYNSITAGISSDSGKYVWDIPKDILSTKCLIRFRDNSTLDTLAESELFKIKPYVITKIDTTTGDFIPYDITKDRWGFGNYPNDMWPATWYSQFNYHGIDPFTNLLYPADIPFIGANSSGYVDWPSFVRAFGLNTCYWNITNGTYNLLALTRWSSEKEEWGGSCFAIAGSNALAFEKKDEFRNKFQDFPDFNTPINVTSDYDVIKPIAELYAQVYGNPTQVHYKNNWLNKTPNQTLSELKEMLKTDITKIQTLTFWNSNNTGAHTILPYKVEKSTIVNTNWLIWVWDNAVPDDATAFVYIDTSANNNNGTWYYANLPTWGGPGRLILDLECSTYLGTPTLPKGRSHYSPFILSDTILQVMTSYHNDIQIEDNQGHTTGYADSLLSYDIPGSVPLILPTGKETPPYGYHLKKDSYSITLDNFIADTINSYIFTGNKAFSYSRYGAISTQTDRLYFDEGISVVNPDAVIKNIRIMSLVNDTTNEKMGVVRLLELSQDDSVRLENLEERRIKFTSYGTSKTYSLNLTYSTDTGIGRYKKSDISIGIGTAHILEPNWIELENSLLIILVDEGDDGTIDDTLRLQNDLTGIHDQGSLIPGEYKLYQNYPNPFNPITTVKYDIPKASYVTLKVFNMLGQEVQTLVNEKQEARGYEVQIDGSKLPSGVYFYRLVSKDYTATKKFILLK
jgi:hypothetical protein